jgi:tetratricopeptide (TPR) repeat protein
MLDGESPLQLPDRPAGLVDAGVAAWREPVTIGTYLPEPPDRHPAYLDRRVYQGSSGRVYPLPFHDRISSTREPVAWDGVHLENRWLRVLVLPQLGGRIHVGHDRSAGYDFFYRNPVIKPALVGLAGPWIAGGVEFNWPQHHRPATFLPTDVEIEHEPDGAVTVWCSDHDPFARMKGMHGVRLHPDRAVIEVRARLYNRSEQTQTFLWWANVAARVHEQYQSFFPRDVRVVADHAKRAVTAFPAADRPYYGIDYPARRSNGGDRLDWYRNIPVPTSYMCVGSREGFFGGYDHAARAGFVHVADPHIAVGKKQWTWGNAEFGHAWDRNLSDDGAAYVELMAGVFTDNQPDFSFIAPGETKVFSQVWYPIQEIGPVHAATVDAAVRVDVEPGGVQVGVVVTAQRPGCLLRLEDFAGAVLAEVSADIAPGAPHRSRIALQVPDRLVLRVLHEGAELVAWHSHVPDAAADAGPATEPAAPADVASVEELAVIGAHLEQYRHATRSPEPYWREALRRDPGHVASSVGLAGRAYRRGEPAVAEALLRAAVARLTSLNANPADTAALYALGLVLERRGLPQEAYARYAAASWARAWRAPAGYRMARIDAAHGRDTAALARLEDVLRAEPEHLQARALTALLLRRTGRPEESAALLRDTLALDPLDWWTRDLAGLPLVTDAQTCLDVALEYAGVGEPDAALRVLDAAAQREDARALGQTAAGPLIEYHRADLLDRAVSGYECSSTRIHSRPGAGRRASEARAARERARAVDATWCFPSRLDDVAVLERAAAADHTDARALALLGHWRYGAGRADDAIAAWRESAALDPSDPVVWRNLGLAAYNHLGDAEQARAAYDRALGAAGGTDARLAFESDQLDARRGVAPQRRLESLLGARALVESRDDATVALAHLLLTAGRLGEARSLLLGRTFQPWEGGEGEVLRAWDRLCRLRSRQLTGAAAATAIDEALDPPASLGEARHPLASTAALQLLRGDALAAAGDGPGAAAAWERAAQDGDFRDMAADPHSEATFSSVLALRRLGRDGDARRRTESLRVFVDGLESAPTAVDYFATSLPSMLLFTEDPAVARRRRVAFLHAQLDVLDGAHRRAVERLDGLLTEDPHHIDALELADVLRDQRPVLEEAR